MGTPDLAQESLQRLYEKGHEIIGVVTNPDKPKGRGMKLTASPVKEYAIEKNLPIYQPEKVKNNEEFIQTIKGLAPQLICVVAYGKILPKEILDIPTKGCINAHVSLLPKYRGSAPINWAILNGDKVTGVTTIYMDEGMDSGDIILQKEHPIRKDETAGELWEELSTMAAELLVETVDLIQKEEAPRRKQPQKYTLAPMLYKEMSEISWDTMTAKQIDCLIRGLNPVMGAYTTYQGKKIKFWKVSITEELEDKKEKAGTILKADTKIGCYIQTKEGIIKILEIQAENAKRMSISDFLRGNPLQVGTILGK